MKTIIIICLLIILGLVVICAGLLRRSYRLTTDRFWVLAQAYAKKCCECCKYKESREK